MGLGTGRCGTESLSRLLNSQEATYCFHEVNPSCASWVSGLDSALNTFSELKNALNGDRHLTFDFSTNLKSNPIYTQFKNDSADIRHVGDVASYYLPHAEAILLSLPQIKILCIERNRVEVINSFEKKMELTFYSKFPTWSRCIIDKLPVVTHRNHFLEHIGMRWKLDQTWDKCFPKFESSELREAIGRYWDLYHSEVRRLKASFPQSVEIFEIDDLNSSEGQMRILNFCGIDRGLRLYSFHANRS